MVGNHKDGKEVKNQAEITKIPLTLFNNSLSMDTNIKRIPLPFEGNGNVFLISDWDNLYILCGGESFRLYVVAKDSFEVLQNKSLNFEPSYKFRMFQAMGQLFIVTLDEGRKSRLYALDRDYELTNTYSFTSSITNLLKRNINSSYVTSTNAIYFTTKESIVSSSGDILDQSKLIQFTISPFFSEGKPIPLAIPPGMGVGCSIIDKEQRFSYVITTGQLISVIKIDLMTGKVNNSFNLHSGGEVATCWIDHESDYMFFSQNIYEESSSIMKFCLTDFRPVVVMQLHNKMVQYIISGTLIDFDNGLSKIYLSSEVDSPSQLVEILAPQSTNQTLIQSNFAVLTRPGDDDWNPGGIKSKFIVDEKKEYGYIARASSPAEINQVLIDSFVVTKRITLDRTPEERLIERITLAARLSKDTILYGTATQPSYLAVFNTTSMKIQRIKKLCSYRLGLQIKFNKDRTHFYVVTDTTISTILRVNAETLEVESKFKIASYFTCAAVDLENDVLYLPTAGRCVYRVDMKSTELVLNEFLTMKDTEKDGYPLSTVFNKYTKRLIVAYESLHENEYTIVEYDSEGHKTRSHKLNANGVIRTAMHSSSENNQNIYFVTYGANSNIIVFDTTVDPFCWQEFVLYHIAIAIGIATLSFIFIGIILYFNVRKSLYLRLRAEREVQQKLLEQPTDYGAIAVSESDENKYVIDLESLKFSESISEGAFGVVFRGKWRNTEVAIKKIKGSTMIDMSFTREVNLMASLRHPNIVQFLGICITSQHRFIVTEYISGGSLDKWIFDSKKKLSLKKKINILLDIAQGMDYLHSLSPPLVHRDLKPQNVLVDKQGCAKVCDFGLSTAMTTSMTLTGNVGTLQYMSPEVMDNAPYDTKSDVYSFAILMWEVLFERPAFSMKKDQPLFQLGISILKGARPPLPDTYETSFHHELAQIVEYCWNRNEHKRPSFDEIIDSLNDVSERIDSIASS
eukprot:CAMPEP_0117430990 /NCGR_PEP_ID=MMETSP0758-20121206/10551_1 /TAXON_ID=63605 /ORGANISM="Percolomonas cosmopolitus, Strain AE-1 (ATCC 50343)" /LENGTH=966 /DNA_ID=CAMNT_0005219605 /DNA_START=278 /DNA_END=3181 /DNA_ORIENTATION=+